MTYFEIFGTVTLPVTVKNWLSISLWEVCLYSKFGKLSSLTRRNMTDKQNHMTMSILCHQHLRRTALRLFTKRCISYLSSVTKPYLEKESSGSASVYEISTRNYIAWFSFPLPLWRELFWNNLDGWKSFCQFSFHFFVTNVISFSCNKEPLMRKTGLRARENFLKKIIYVLSILILNPQSSLKAHDEILNLVDPFHFYQLTSK